MNKANELPPSDEMRAEYDFRGGVRGNLAKVFHDSEAVNVALRQFLSEHGEPPHPSKDNAR